MKEISASHNTMSNCYQLQTLVKGVAKNYVAMVTITVYYPTSISNILNEIIQVWFSPVGSGNQKVASQHRTSTKTINL